MVLNLWASPSTEKWNAVKAEAMRNLWNNLKVLEGTQGQ
jgi:hypothetical protein